VYEESRVEGEAVVNERVRVAPGTAVPLEELDVVPARKHVRCTKPGNAASDDRYAHNRYSVGCEYRVVMIDFPAVIDAPEDTTAQAAAVRLATVRERTSRISQVVTVVAVLVPPLGVAAAVGLLWNVAFHPGDLVIMVGMYVLCAFGTTIGFHRYFTHRAFEARSPVKATLAILGCMTMQGPLTQWVTDHRKHHALSDREGDPHSPHAGHDDGGVVGVWKGFAHAHVGWMFTSMGMEQGHLYGRDLYEDRLVRTIDRLYMLWVVATLGIPFGIGFALGGWERGIEGLLWGGLVRIFLYQHATFSVNSICHMFGRQDYRSRDESRNNWLVALLVFGEGWHNNHHAFPASARHGLHRFQIDVSWWVIRALEKLRLVWDVKVPNEVQLRRRRLRAPQPANVSS
jgi:stearoyl-CoA desaturase (delta-9 desaturase)